MRKSKLLLCVLLVSILGISMFGKTTANNNDPNSEISDEVYLIVSAEYSEETSELLPDDEILEITNATYLDIDGDGSEDDILTDFIFRVPTGNLAYMICDIYVSLELPSTNTFHACFRFIGIFIEVSFFLDWINVATEGGDYIFFVEINSVGIDVMGNHISEYISNSIVFDPPCAGPVGGMPS